MSVYLAGEPLFLERKRDFEKIGNVKLGPNPKEWEAEVLDMLHQQHPYLIDSRIGIKFKKIDKETGSGIGAISLDDVISIPIVVDNFRMAPLDVFLSGQNIEPLTRTKVEAALKSNAIGKPVAPGKGEITDSSITNMTTPPYDGKYTFASSLKFTKDEFSDSVNRVFDEQGFTFELHNNTQLRDVLEAYLGNCGEHTKTAEEKLSVKLSEPSKFKLVKTAGIYDVPTSLGTKTGVLAPITVKLATEQNRNIFVGLDGTYVLLKEGEAIPAVEVDKIKYEPKDLDGRGVFLFHKEGHIEVTEPLTLIYKSDHPVMRNDLGHTYKLYKSAQAQHIEISGGIICLPENVLFLPLTKTATIVSPTVADNVADTITITKRANKYFTKSSKDILPTNEGYYLDDFIKEAEQIFDPVSVEQLVKTGKFVVEYPEVKKSEKTYEISDENKELFTKVASLLDNTASQFIKISAEESKKTIDSLLGLNFLNKQNLNKFIDNMDKIAEAKQVVGQLLIASRLGLEIDQAPLRNALFALDEINQDLTQLYNVTNE